MCTQKEIIFPEIPLWDICRKKMYFPKYPSGIICGHKMYFPKYPSGIICGHQMYFPKYPSGIICGGYVFSLISSLRGYSGGRSAHCIIVQWPRFGVVRLFHMCTHWSFSIYVSSRLRASRDPEQWVPSLFCGDAFELYMFPCCVF